jgi:hypothetical protein
MAITKKHPADYWDSKTKNPTTDQVSAACEHIDSKMVLFAEFSEMERLLIFFMGKDEYEAWKKEREITVVNLARSMARMKTKIGDLRWEAAFVEPPKVETDEIPF